MALRENLERVRARLAEAASASGRDPGEIRVIAVTKTVEPAQVKEAIEAGVTDIGENRAQEARAKFDALGEDACRLRWHFIGHLQTNKVKYVVKICDMIHSLDRLSLAYEIDKRARRAGRVLETLVQVNVSGEKSKFGLPPEEVPGFVRRVAQLQGLRIVGLMTMAPYTSDAEETRPYFRGLRQLFRRLEADPPEGVEMKYLSMGMSNDYVVAVQEGANMVRIGTAIFGAKV